MQKVQFNGSGFEYFKIWIVNILLTIVTLTLYYPWAKVRNNRYFYANTQVGEHNFEYHATGKQLFPGYLIALGLLIAYVLFQQFSPVGTLVVILIFFIGFPWIIWKGLQFNLKMTSYANVRFSFNGSLGDSYFNFMLLLILSGIAFYGIFVGPAIVVTFLSDVSGVVSGILAFVLFILMSVLAVYAFAYKKKRNSEYLINERKFGNGSFATTLSARPFVKILFKTMLLSIAATCILMFMFGVLAAAFAGIAALSELKDSFDDPSVLAAQFGALAILIVPMYIAMIAMFLLVNAYMQARIRNYIYGNTVLDNKIKFQSTLTARSLCWILLSNLLLIVFTLGLATPWAKVRLARLYTLNTLVDTEVDISEYVTEQQAEQSTLGEQIGDAFDVGIGVSI